MNILEMENAIKLALPNANKEQCALAKEIAADVITRFPTFPQAISSLALNNVYNNTSELIKIFVELLVSQRIELLEKHSIISRKSHIKEAIYRYIYGCVYQLFQRCLKNASLNFNVDNSFLLNQACAIACRKVDFILKSLKNMFDQIEQDRIKLNSIVPGFNPDSMLANIRLGVGDTHNQGKAVTVLCFDDGFRFVYKPRPADTDIAWCRLVRWINTNLKIKLTAVPTVDCITHGYSVYVETIRSLENEAAKQNLRQVGMLLGVLEALHSSDMHFENILISHQGPIVLDTETLLTPQFESDNTYAKKSASRIAASVLNDSVLGVGLLPTLVGNVGRGMLFDVGFLGYQNGQKTPYRSIIYDKTDNKEKYFRPLVDREAPLALFDNIPVFLQRDLVVEGYNKSNHEICLHWSAFQREVYSVFRDVRVRVVPVPSMRYSQLLKMSHNPEALRDPEIRAAVFSRVVLLHGNAPASKELVTAEARQLVNEDIPYFYCRSNDNKLRCMVDDEELVLDELATTPLGRVTCPKMEEKQGNVNAPQRFIDLAFVNRLEKTNDKTAVGKTAGITKDNLELEILRILDGLDNLAVRSCDIRFPPTWIDPSISVPDQSQWLPGTLGYDLYGGVSGIALVLAAGANVFQQSRYADLATSVMNPLAKQFYNGAFDGTHAAVGGFIGVGGTAYAITAAARLLPHLIKVDEQSLLKTILNKARIPNQSWDIVTGLTGGLAASLYIAKTNADLSVVEELAALTYAVLLKVDWESAYSGFAHGAAGAAYVLIKAADMLNSTKLLRLGRKILDKLLNRVQSGKCPRTLSHDDCTDGAAWCHGTAGILLALGKLSIVHPELIKQDIIELMAENLMRHGFGNNPSLCHGDAGTLSILTTIAAEMPTLKVESQPLATIVGNKMPEVLSAAKKAREERMNRYGFVSSLMIGSAGTAWAAMRSLHPYLLPELLGLCACTLEGHNDNTQDDERR